MPESKKETPSEQDKSAPRQISDTEIVAQMKTFAVCREKWVLNGKEITIEYARPRDAAVVLPITKEGKLVLVRQFRPVIRGYIYEAIAGQLDQDKLSAGVEAPSHNIEHEAREEAGLVIGSAEKVVDGPASPGRSSEILHLFVAQVKGKVERSPEAGEVISKEYIELMPQEADNLLKNGEIRDIKTRAIVRDYLAYVMEKNAERLGIDYSELLRPIELGHTD